MANSTKRLPVPFIILGMAMPFASCHQILLFRYGIHQPREETPERIMHFMEKRGYSNENTFIFKDTASFFACMRDSVFRTHVPGMMVFDHNGNMNVSRDTTPCRWLNENFARLLPEDTLGSGSSLFTLRQLRNCMVPLYAGTKTDTSIATCFVMVCWATFLGRYNDRLFSIREWINKNHSVRIQPLFLCIDLQKEWNLNLRNRKVLQFN